MLIVIFRKLDLRELVETSRNVNPWLLIMGLSYYPLVVICAGIRWKVAMHCYFQQNVPAGFLVRQYWIGMVLGFFSPGSIGMDLYRILVGGRKFGHFLYTIFIVIVEKIMALLTVVCLALFSYPIVEPLVVTHAAVLDRISDVSFLVGGLGITAAIVFCFCFKRLFGSRFTKWLMAKSDEVQEKLVSQGYTTKTPENTGDLSKVLKLISQPHSFVWVFFWSLMIQVISAMGNQILFQSIGYEISFWVNLFAVPVFYFIFLVPISFGSLGIREGSYILLYGLFGVPAEVAVLVSFINLTGILLNNAVGAVLMWTDRQSDVVK